MEQRPLRHFVAVAEEHCFSKAAQRLGITQPALSRQIRKLEEELGVQLFRRTTVRVELTEAGQLFLEEVRRGLQHLEWATRVARQAGRGQAGRLSIGVEGSVTYSVLPLIAREFHARCPEVNLELSEMTSGQQLAALQEERLRLGLLRPPTGCSGLNIEPLMTEAVMVVLPRGHRLACEPKIFLGDLGDVPLLLVQRDAEPALFDLSLQLCADAEVTPRIVHASDHLHVNIGLVAAGMGFTVLPASVRNLQRPDVIYRALKPPAPKVALAAAWRPDDDSPVLHAFLAVAREVTRLHRPNGADQRLTIPRRETASRISGTSTLA